MKDMEKEAKEEEVRGVQLVAASKMRENMTLGTEGAARTPLASQT